MNHAIMTGVFLWAGLLLTALPIGGAVAFYRQGYRGASLMFIAMAVIPTMVLAAAIIGR